MTCSINWLVLVRKWRFFRGHGSFHSLRLGRILCVTERKSFTFDYQDTSTDSRINLKLSLNLIASWLRHEFFLKVYAKFKVIHSPAICLHQRIIVSLIDVGECDLLTFFCHYHGDHFVN